MKHILTTLLCGLLVTFAACSNDPAEGERLRFATPEATDISGSAATVNCKLLSGAAVLPNISAGFLYGTEQDDPEDYLEAAEVTTQGAVLSCRLKGLQPETAYKVMAYVALGDDAVRVFSPAVSFSTATLSPDETVLELTSKTNVVMAADGGPHTITYELVNPRPDGKVLASCESEWVHSFTYADGSITCTVDKNTGDERYAVINITYPEAEARQVDIRQEPAADLPEQPGQSIELSINSGWPKTYQDSHFKLGDYNYALTNVADYGNGIQFKKVSGKLANQDDMGAITRIEIVYQTSKTSGNDFKLYLGDAPNPSGTALEASEVDKMTYVFDCTGTASHYFSLVNGEGASYLKFIKIYTGEGGVTPPTPGEPSFGAAASADVTQNNAAISCSFDYKGSGTISSVYFAYRTSTGTDQQAAVTTQPGTKSATLTGLTPSTLYTFRLCVVVNGTTYTSPSATFVTLREGGVTPPPVSGVYKSGWAELPVEIQKPNDYYYAHHMREDARSIRNFTVCYSKEYECPVWVASPMHSSYKGSSGRNDAYKQDPQLGCSQVGKRDGYTRGHMLGSSDRTVSVSTNKQVFYYSNIAPQLSSGFNTGGGVWNNLEDYTDGKWCSDTLYLVNGCYWANTDKKASGTTIPTHYYKLLLRTKKGNSGRWVVDCSREELMCVAFLVEHNSKQHMVKPNRNMLKSVAELEQMTGFTFFPNVPNAPKESFNAADWGL